MTPQQVIDDVAARIRAADQEATDATAAFIGGRFREYIAAKSAKLLAKLKADADAILKKAEAENVEPNTPTGDSGASGGGSAGAGSSSLRPGDPGPPENDG